LLFPSRAIQKIASDRYRLKCETETAIKILKLLGKSREF
jgi:hypothetical protein